jgi:hypothetical protein
MTSILKCPSLLSIQGTLGKSPFNLHSYILASFAQFLCVYLTVVINRVKILSGTCS